MTNAGATHGTNGAASDSVRIAAIDIGSNSIRQIVADVSTDGKIRIVDEMKATPRLGAGVDASGQLGDASMQSALAALTRMATLAHQMDVARIDAVATSAVRDAANGGAFLERVRAEAGLRVRLLTGEEEARLAFRSALARFELGAGRTVVMDIGGGSLELALAADGLLDSSSRCRSAPSARPTASWARARDRRIYASCAAPCATPCASGCRSRSGAARA
jgi:exopolyphosphatase/pppGpp-phosphohydrolase